MKKLSLFFLFHVLCSMFHASAFATEAEPLITDRPDTAESSKVVGKYRLQVETSFAFGHNNDNNTTTRTYNFPTLVRFGVLPWLELRAESEMNQFQTQTGQNTQRGFTDIAFGFKTHLLDNEGWVPSMGVLFHIGTPTGHDNFTSNTYEPMLKWLNDWGLPADFSLGTNIGFDVPARNTNGEKYARVLYAGTVGHPVTFISENLNTFVEVQGIVPVESTDPNEHTFDAGFTFIITPDIQVDTFIQIGLVEATTDITTGIGFSWRML